MIQRFLLIVRRAPGGPPVPADALVRSTGLELALDAPRFALLTTPQIDCFSLAGSGAVFGTLFHRHGPSRPIQVLDEADASSIAATAGAQLLADFWGGYIALIEGVDGPLLLRDPSGALPCYLALHADYLFAASHVDLLLRTGAVRTSIDFRALAAHLYSAGLPGSRTVLAGIEELLPGFSVRISGRPAGQQPCWSPWDHVSQRSSDDIGATAEGLRRSVVQCVRGWAANRTRIVLSVSGGLDLSIVAASLAGSGAPDVHCVTMFGDDPTGDERDYARALCRTLGLPLFECHYRVEDVDIDAPLGAHLPLPFGRTQSSAYERAHLEVARRIGADAFMTGNGGDNVFAYSQSAAAIADRYLAEGLGAGLFRTLRDVCRQTGCSMFEAVGSTVRILRMKRSYRWRPSETFLAPDVVAELGKSGLEHPWLDAPPDALPGKAGHIAGMLRVQPNLLPGRSLHAPVLNPLVSQPVMEACLAIPSWQWRDGGFDRAVARAAFATALPDLIVKRRGKGGPDGFTARIVAHFRPAIRERLLDGLLARHGLLDTAAVEKVLADRRPTLGEERSALLTLLSTEAWLRFWSARL